MRRFLFPAVALALLTLLGCQRLNYEQTYSLDEGVAYQTAKFDAPRGDQRLTVTATSTKEPVNVFIVLAEDENEGIRAVSRRTNPKKVLGGQENAKEISFDATIPAKKEFILFVCTAKGARRITDVKISVKGR